MAKRIHGLGVVAACALLAACATPEPIRIDGGQTAGEPGVLWPYATYKKKLFERWNHAIVVEVDGVRTLQMTTNPPVELSPGRHTARVRFERDSWLCGYFGCVSFEQTTVDLDLAVEPDHSYVPQAGKYCGRDWVWIVDIGGGARQHLQQWREHGKLPYRPFALPGEPQLTDHARVVAGEAPPASCTVVGE